jgi:hypothetical protein
MVGQVVFSEAPDGADFLGPASSGESGSHAVNPLNLLFILTKKR